MRLAVTTLVLCTLTLPYAKSDDAQLKLDPPNPDLITLVYDTALSGNTSFCAATPVKQNLSIQVDCIGSPSCTNEYTLSGSTTATIPIQLQLTDKHNHTDSKPLTLNPSQQYENLGSQGANCNNNENIRTITVNVNKHDIDWTKAPFSRTFQVTARNIDKNRIETEEFTVIFGEDDFIRISGLKDLALTHKNNRQASNKQVCVFSSAPTYRLTATSANNGELVLTNQTSRIPYTLQYKEHNTAAWKDMTFNSTYSNLTASTTEACLDGTYLGIQVVVQESASNNTTTGRHSDTVTLTAEAE